MQCKCNPAFARPETCNAEDDNEGYKGRFVYGCRGEDKVDDESAVIAMR